MADVSKSVNIAINVINGVTKQVGAITGSFKKMTNDVENTTKAVGQLNAAFKRLQAPGGLKNLAKDLKDISNINSNGIDKVADGLNKMQSIKFPSFTNINNDLAQHAKRVRDVVDAYNQLAKVTNGVNLKNITSSANSANNSINNLNNTANKGKVSFSQWGYAIGSASTGLSKFGTQIYGVTRGFSAVSKEMNIAMLAFTTAFSSMFAIKGVVKDIVEFDDAIRAAGAVAGASSTQMTQLSDAARAMGESTRYTAKDAADALKALAMTGLDVNESISTLPTVLNLAAAANMDLGQSADIVTNIMVGYGKAVSDLPHIADLMTAAFTNSNTGLEELGVAMKYVGPVAKEAGLSLEETTGILASLANAGYRGSKAGTTLRTAIARLLAPTKQMTSVMDEYSITMDDIVGPDGKMFKFSDILETIRSKSVTTGDALTLFGKIAGPGILSLIGQGTVAIDEMNKKIAESEGVSLKVAYEMEAGLGGALRRLKSMWEEVSIAIGKTIETDVQSFIEALTKSLRENKAEIVQVAKSIFELLGVAAKLAGWAADFVAGHVKLLSAFAAITVAIKLYKSEMLAAIAVNAIGFFKTLGQLLTGKGIAAGITSIADGVRAFNSAAKLNAGAQVATSFKALQATNFAGIAGGIGGVTTAFGGLRAAIAAFVAANPALVAISVTLGAILGIGALINTNYKDQAESIINSTSVNEDLNRTLEYQLAELKLINKELENGKTENFASAQQRLLDVILSSNVSLDEKIRLTKLVKEGTEGAKKAQEELNAAIDEQRKKNLAEELGKIAEARFNNAKAARQEYVDTVAANHEMYDSTKKTISITENLGSSLRKTFSLKGIADSLTFGLIYSLHSTGKEMKDLDKASQDYEAKLTEMIKKMHDAGVTTQEFSDALAGTDMSAEDLNKAKEIWAELSKEIEGVTNKTKEEVEEELRLAQQRENNAIAVLEAYKQSAKEREAIEKSVFENIARAEAEGVITHEQAASAKTQATIDAAQAELDAALAAQAQIGNVSEETAQKAADAVAAAEARATQARTQALEGINQQQEQLAKQTEQIEDQKEKEIERHAKSTQEAQEKYLEDTADAQEKTAEKVQDINEKLGEDLKKIDEKIAEKREEFAKERLEVEKSVADNITRINMSTEDKIRAIQQRGMSDREKDRDNESAADKKLAEGKKLIEEARKSGDEAALERGKDLISQAQDLYSGLEDERDAINGVKESAEQLKEAEKARGEVAQKAIADKQKAEEEAAQKARKASEDAAAKQIEDEQKALQKSLGAIDEAYMKQMQKENEQHSNTMKNLQDQQNEINKKNAAIEKEKQNLIELSKQYENLNNTAGDKMSTMWDAANTATQTAIDKAKEFSAEVDNISNKEVNVQFTGTASPTAPLGEKIDEIKQKLEDLKIDDIEVNIKFMGEDGENLDSSLEKMKAKFAEIEITLPIKTNTEELQAAIALIEQYKESQINITIKVNKAELDQAVALINTLVDKTVTITAKVIGYDSLVKLKSMIDSIQSKTVTVTTKTKTVSENAAGGLIGPEHYATGGSVFKRLSNRFIGTGSGKKDDVPAMLMKGEFVQKVSAVKKYGVDFMKKLNAGLLPASIAKGFNTGGYVEPEHYATGGHVGYSGNINKMFSILPKLKRKDLLEMFGEKISSRNLNIEADNITTELGAKSIIGMRNAITDVVSAFASGGNISNTIANFAAQKRDINNAFTKEISAAKSSGNNDIASVLKKERDQLIEESSRLKSELDKLKAEYEADVLDATASYNEEKADRDQSYKRDSDDAKLDYERDSSDAKLDYDRDKEDYKKDKKDLKSELDASLLEIADKNSDSEFLSSLTDAKEALGEIFKELNVIGSSMTGKVFRRQTMGKTYTWDQLESLRKAYSYGVSGSDIPNFSKIENAFKTMSWSKNETIPKLKENYIKNIAEMDDILSSMNEILSPLGYESFATGMKGEDLDQTGIERYKRFLNEISLGDAAKKSAEVQMQNEKDSINNQYKLDLSDIEKDFSQTTDDYNTEKKRRDDDYGTEKTRKDEDYNTESIRSKYDFESTLNELKANYEEGVSSQTSDSKDNVSSIKEEANNSIKEIKSAMAEAITNAQTARDEKLSSLTASSSAEGSTTDTVESTTDTVAEYSSVDILDLLRRKLGIRGFNTGGYVNRTATSVIGKDSILSALAPDEFVVRAAAVRKFGRGFFESLNNFKIPAFNTGGLVGNIGNTLINGGTAEQVIRHVLDLSINGSRVGELSGSPMTIDRLLNDLTLAKLRS